jgi:hypothetical protein
MEVLRRQRRERKEAQRGAGIQITAMCVVRKGML